MVDLEELIVAAPKVELHVHLEGTIRPSTAAEWGRQMGCPVQLRPAPGWSEFLACWKSVCGLLTRPEHFRRLVEEYGEDAAGQGIVYSELFFSPEPHTRHHGYTLDQLFEAMEQGRRMVEERWGVHLRWIADGVRDSSTGTESCRRTVEWMTKLQHRGGLLGLGLGGSEEKGPPELFSSLFQRAREAGFHVVAHAGELVDNVISTVDHLRVERIGHGVQCWKNKRALERLRAGGIPLELCPTSNLVMGALPDLSVVGKLIESGVEVCINSDDPGLLGTDLTSELLLVTRECGLEKSGLRRLLAVGIEKSFAPPSWKEGWLEELNQLFEVAQADVCERES